ncbi:MAG: sulfite exporter TauE/SafE family protein [Bacteriovoracaceae bacterium]
MILAYALALVVGLSLGLLGGGGSIITVPILVYVIGMTPKLAVASSLVVVGSTSLIGSISHFRAGNLELKTGAIFGSIAMVGAYLSAKTIAPMIPGAFQLIMFATIMLMASIFMLKGRKVIETNQENKELPVVQLLIFGSIVGIVTGLVGVGGGFLIVPALHLLAKVPMKKAVGTSLLIIAANSFSGYLGYISQVQLDWSFMLFFIAFTALGILLGSWLVKFIPAENLKKAFGVFLIFMGIYILYKERSRLMTTYQEIKNEQQLEIYA